MIDSDKKQYTNYLKIRGDHATIKFSSDMTGNPIQSGSETAQGGQHKGHTFEIQGTDSPSWATGDEFTLLQLRNQVEPWLTALFQSEHLSLLAGSGLTTAIHILTQGKPATGMQYSIGSDELQKRIDAAAAEVAGRSNRGGANIEDKIRVANEALQVSKLYESAFERSFTEEITQALQEFFEQFTRSILASEQGMIDCAEDKKARAFNALVNFLTSFASRTGTRDRVHIFTTNYDRLIEEGAELAGIHLVDRFVGNLAPIFRSSRLSLDLHYNPPGIRGEPRYLEGVARFTKLHGSLDWVQVGREIRRIGLPFGAESVAPYLKAPGLKNATPHEMMIFPNSAKDRETAGYPYVDLFRDLAAAICRPNSTLVTYGYGFGDEHINRVMEDMLTIPSTHLVIISRDFTKRMEALAEARPAQVSLLIGPALSDIQQLTTHFLPKAAIDRATSRMSELLKDRHGANYVGGGQITAQNPREQEPELAIDLFEDF